jgi:cyanophycin synthetase
VKILKTQVIEGRNVWSHSPVLKTWLYLSPRERFSTAQLPGFADKLQQLLPGLKAHICGRGYPGGFIERLQEGTYLRHVVEHVALELQVEAGFSVHYGKTVRGEQPGIWEIILEYSTPELAKAAVEMAVALVSASLAERPFPVHETLAKLHDLGAATRPGPSTESILQACRRRGIPALPLADGACFQLGYGSCQKRIQSTITCQTSAIAVDLASDKEATKRLLAKAGLPVATGRLAVSWERALSAARELGYPVVVKPCRGNQGKGVFLAIKNDQELESAYRLALKYDKHVLVEKHVEGRHYRLLVIDGKVVAAAERFPAVVIGDGIHTIRELIEIANQDSRRGQGHDAPLTKMGIDQTVLLELKRQGCHPKTCPQEGAKIYLRRNANLSTGGSAADVTAQVCPENKYMAEQAADIIGLDVAGVDLVAPAIDRPLAEGEGAIIEVNAAPGFRMHLYPDKGVLRDVGNDLVNYLFPPGSRVSIPVISITGTNGKTTTARMLGHFFQQEGLNVGMTTTEGVYINKKCIYKGDSSGPDSARAVLQDSTVDIAVLETARGGILRGGLGYDRADVAVVTNIAPDHLGQNGIETLEDLFWVKSLVVEAVKKDGIVVLNADDPFAPRLAACSRCKVIFFSLHENNVLVSRHLGAGGCAVFVNRGFVFFGCGEHAVRLIGLKSIRAGMGGRAAHNLENALAAAAAAYACEVPFAAIRRGLRSFGACQEDNPGRLTIQELRGVTVIVDYGHNAPAFQKIAEFARTLSKGRLIGIIGVPGDRRDDQIIHSGQVAATGFDELYIREDHDLRGRDPEETAKLLYTGARRAGMPASNLHVIPEILCALDESLRRAKPGDVVVVFYEEIRPVLDYLRNQERIEKNAAVKQTVQG